MISSAKVGKENYLSVVLGWPGVKKKSSNPGISSLNLRISTPWLTGINYNMLEQLVDDLIGSLLSTGFQD